MRIVESVMNHIGDILERGKIIKRIAIIEDERNYQDSMNDNQEANKTERFAS